MASDLLAQQLDYYRARAQEYDEVFLRQGRYDRGEGHRIVWDAEMRTVEDAVLPAVAGRRVLELACGTGLWTERLVRRASSVTAVDGAPEMLAETRKRLGPDVPNLQLEQHELFAEPRVGTYDVVFFSFWLSHVPRDRFDRFWRWTTRCLAPDGTVVFVDSCFAPRATAVDHPRTDGDDTSLRKLNDGRTFAIVKVYYQPEEIVQRLERLGLRANVDRTPEFFLYGRAKRAPGAGVMDDGNRGSG